MVNNNPTPAAGRFRTEINMVFVDDRRQGRLYFHPLVAAHFRDPANRSLALLAMDIPDTWFTVGDVSMIFTSEVPDGFEEMVMRDQRRFVESN